MQGCTSRRIIRAQEVELETLRCEPSVAPRRPHERRQKEQQIKAAINQKLVESGERDRLKELLRTRLIECGWKDQLKAHCKEIIKDKGVENLTVDDLIAAVTPQGRATVPDSIKRELLHQIRNFLAERGGS
ncbi:transcription factor E(Y)2, putative [Ixodes scapularis]|uniref:Transcription and mRNA export factor ENY2 n=1 Tax=Ixodes scapularis TaxID=6945 RepID=B7Q2C5_IXOSC|nr:transcription factor E(Y)2, putative [Ixodes scapularis]|eukprot:XP_002410674.1 transcription factor E(Y)2, putative [Ixodes scapularis]